VLGGAALAAHDTSGWSVESKEDYLSEEGRVGGRELRELFVEPINGETTVMFSGGCREGAG
jgi:hypothetical protein